MNVLVTGGMGYIGSHTVVELLNAGDNVIVVDNLINSKIEVKEKIETITGKTFKCYEEDLINLNEVYRIFRENKIDSVIHFAALKAVGESVSKPLEYYENNLISTLNVLRAMKQYNVKNFVFSSSATVYGEAKTMPILEDFELSATNPYGRSKLIIEDVLRDLYNADKNFNIAILRYFNPVGAHESGLIGENPNGIPNNLMPYITQVAIGKLSKLNVFGNDYNTKDGTGVRDYIHVVDLAKGHVSAIEYANEHKGTEIFNLGTGNGYSVLEMVNSFSKINNVDVPYEIAPRRAGDIAACYANADKAFEKMHWKAEKTLDEMCKDTWKWQTKNPTGY